MPTPYFQLLGHLALADHTRRHNPEVESALADHGFGDDKWQTAERLVEQGESLIDRRAEEGPEERNTEHEVHSSGTEVEMWMQNASFRLKKAVDDQEILDKTRGADIHSDDHNVEVVQRTLRMIGMIRTSPVLHEQFGTDRSVKDLLIRGNTLLSKMLDAGDKWLAPSHAGNPDAEVFRELEKAHRSMKQWLQSLDDAARLLDEQPAILGELGYVPEGVGLPLGGTGYSITLHERSHREPPDPNEEPKSAPSWTVGRQQGQNNENMGEGWVEPSFD